MQNAEYNLYSMRAHGLDRTKIPIRIFHRKHNRQAEVPNHHHDFMEIALVLSGSATHTIQQQERRNLSYPVTRGDICVIVPGQSHSFSFDEDESIEIINILFNQTVFQKISALDEDQMNLPEFLTKLSHPSPERPSSLHLPDEVVTQICTLVSDIERESIQHTTGYSTMVLLHFSAILTLLYRQYRSSMPLHSVAETELVTRLAQYIDQHYQEEISLQHLAEVTHFSVRQITRRFKDATGMSILDYILSQRMNHARALLATTDMKVTDIALEVGFNTPSYFCGQFRRVMGCTPNQYREDILRPTGN